MKQVCVILLCSVTYTFAIAQQRSPNLINGFYQTVVDISPIFQSCNQDVSVGNCATIALVKACLGQFKTLNNIYRHFSVNADSFYFVFNDGVAVSVSKNEVDTVKKHSGLPGHPR